MRQAERRVPDDWQLVVQHNRSDADTQRTAAKFEGPLNSLGRVRPEVVSGGVLRVISEPTTTESYPLQTGVYLLIRSASIRLRVISFGSQRAHT